MTAYTSKNTLIPLSAKPASNEPVYPRTSYGRDQLRYMVRACLLRDRSLENTLGQVQRDFGYSKEVKTLIEHFYNVEVANNEN